MTPQELRGAEPDMGTSPGVCSVSPHGAIPAQTPYSQLLVTHEIISNNLLRLFVYLFVSFNQAVRFLIEFSMFEPLSNLETIIFKPIQCSRQRGMCFMLGGAGFVFSGAESSSWLSGTSRRPVPYGNRFSRTTRRICWP